MRARRLCGLCGRGLPKRSWVQNGWVKVPIVCDPATPECYRDWASTRVGIEIGWDQAERLAASAQERREG